VHFGGIVGLLLALFFDNEIYSKYLKGIDD
jgi:hypothetical protein